MLTLFYQMKLAKHKNKLATDDYFNQDENPQYCNSNELNKCRVCLQEGLHSIYERVNSEELLEALQLFGNIQIMETDEYPKYLCKRCLKFIQQAILFRKVAIRSDNILRKRVKEEVYISNETDQHDYSDSSVCENKELSGSWNNEEQDCSALKVEKKEKIKYNAKVTCHICNKVINRSYYKEHITMHDPDHKKYVCEVCGKSFRLRCAYHNHSLRHRTDFLFKCQFCPYKGRYAELLKVHVRTHIGDYRYMCTECPARFLFKSNLNSHMLKHKEPQFKCDSCKRAFHTKLMLQRHFEADHLGIKNHVCNVCGKAFGYRNAMMKHQRQVHKREKLLFGRMPSYLQAQNVSHSNNML